MMKNKSGGQAFPGKRTIWDIKFADDVNEKTRNEILRKMALSGRDLTCISLPDGVKLDSLAFHDGGMTLRQYYAAELAPVLLKNLLDMAMKQEHRTIDDFVQQACADAVEGAFSMADRMIMFEQEEADSLTDSEMGNTVSEEEK